MMEDVASRVAKANASGLPYSFTVLREKMTNDIITTETFEEAFALSPNGTSLASPELVAKAIEPVPRIEASGMRYATWNDFGQVNEEEALGGDSFPFGYLLDRYFQEVKEVDFRKDVLNLGTFIIGMPGKGKSEVICTIVEGALCFFEQGEETGTEGEIKKKKKTVAT